MGAAPGQLLDRGDDGVRLVIQRRLVPELAGPDRPRPVRAEDARLRYGRQSLTDPHVEVVQRSGAQLDEDLSVAWHRVGGLLVAEHLGTAVFVDPDRLHRHNLPYDRRRAGA